MMHIQIIKKYILKCKKLKNKNKKKIGAITAKEKIYHMRRNIIDIK